MKTKKVTKPHYEVSCAVIKKDNKILCCRRGPIGETAYKWEFPGGKIEPGTIIELRILGELAKQNKPIFVDTNIPVNILKEISDTNHVLIMLANPDISVNRFFERQDRDKQFLYQLLISEENKEQALKNFKECIKRINNEQTYNEFLNSGFNVIIRDENRTVEQTLSLVELMFKLK